MSKIKTLQAKNDLMFNNSAIEAQNNFEENLDKLNEINKKYDNEIYELKQEIEEEEIIKKNEEEKEEANSSLKLIYDNLLEDKKKIFVNFKNYYFS